MALRLAMVVLLLLPLSALGMSRVVHVTDVAPVWAGHPVGFCLLTRGDLQFIGFYDAERRMTIGSRHLDSDQWTFKILPTSVGWDSHNSIAMAFDDEGQLHVAGNMHAAPLVYFRTTRPLDVMSLERIHAMTGLNEARCTYPVFLRGPNQEFLFTYRDGHSGGGNQIYDIYNGAAQTWSRLLDQPLTYGGGAMNAYFVGPVRGPDGYFHLTWVWRDTGNCATNHTLSYARSKDMRHWESAAGKPLALPIKLGDDDVVDPVPVHGGIINNNLAIGFDAQKRLIISYQKYDAAGNTQIYNARLENGAWTIDQTSDWNYRWDFSGGGSIPFEIHLGPVRAAQDGTLSQTFEHVKYGSGVWTLDPATLKPTATTKPAPEHPIDLDRVTNDFPGMQVHWKSDSGHSGKPGEHDELRWETLGINRDHPREKPWPPPSMLRVYEFAQ